MKSRIIILGVLASSIVLMNACELKFRGKKIFDNETETIKTEVPEIEVEEVKTEEIMAQEVVAQEVKSQEVKVEKVEKAKAEPIENDNRHLEFKGIPINGSLKKFVTNMKTAGFKTVGSISNGTATLKGDFAGYKDCRLYVQTMDGADIVSSIVVQFPECERWDHLHGYYKDLKEMLIQKYGKSHSVREEFQGYVSRTDDDKMRQVGKGECKYNSEFRTEKGKIILWIEQVGYKLGSVCLQYSDKINSGVVKQKAIDDL
jgi:hypothetical protein